MSALQEITMDIAAERTGNNTQMRASESVRPGFDERGFAFWFAGLSIGGKIRAFYGFNLFVALVAGLIVFLGYYQLGDRGEQIAAQYDYSMDAERLVTALSEAQRHSEMLLAAGENVRAEAALERLDLADEKVAALREKVRGNDAGASKSLRLISEGIADFRRQINTFDPDGTNLFRRENSAAKVQATGSLTLEAGRNLADALNMGAKAMSDESAAFISTLLIVWAGLVAILTALTFGALRYFDRNVGGTLKDMTIEMNKLAAGDNNLTIPGKKRRDEIGEMARAMEVFHRAGKRLERLSQERAEQAKAELDEQTRHQVQKEESRQEREQMLRDVADQFERTVGDVVSGVAEASTQLQTTSKMMAGTAEQSSTRAAEVSASMEEANTGATAAAAASDEFAMSIGEISRQAANSAQLARTATSSAAEADATISALSDSAQQVGQIVELIQTIAQRTNLLALNASIEAARGGEAGRGFAVVASEVKELAMQTSRATEQVANQIRAMQDTTGASVSALRTIADQVHELEATAVSIASAVDQQSVAGQDLARSIDLAARSTEQVANHIEDVRDLSLSTGSAASQVLSSATSLEDQASILRVQVDAFLTKVRST